MLFRPIDPSCPADARPAAGAAEPRRQAAIDLAVDRCAVQLQQAHDRVAAALAAGQRRRLKRHDRLPRRELRQAPLAHIDDCIQLHMMHDARRAQVAADRHDAALAQIDQYRARVETRIDAARQGQRQRPAVQRIAAQIE